MRKERRKIGILTSGGDCPGLNAVIRAVVKSAGHLGYETLGFEKGFEGLVDPIRYRVLDSVNTSGILIQGGTILGSTNKGRFNAIRGENEKQQIDPALVAQAKANLNDLEIDGLICVGGDGSLSIAQQFHEAGIPVVGVPKTIDNDLSCTAFSFGFLSAVACATDALDRLHTTAASHERIMVLEVMGRHAGWIALYAGLAGGGDVILIPEIPWTFDNVCSSVMLRQRMGKRFTLVVVAEGATLPDGKLVALEGEQRDRQTRLGGIGQIVSDELQSRLKMESRCVVLGHLQRGGAPTTFDRALATQYGAHAVRLIEESRFGEMVCYVPPDIKSIPITDAVRTLKKVDANSSAVIAAKALGIGFGDTMGYVNPFACTSVEAPAAMEKFQFPMEFSNFIDE